MALTTEALQALMCKRLCWVAEPLGQNFFIYSIFYIKKSKVQFCVHKHKETLSTPYISSFSDSGLPSG